MRDRLLTISAEVIPLNQEHPAIVFVGGFDPPETVFDHGRTSVFLFNGRSGDEALTERALTS